MTEQAVTIENETGLHARPASMLVEKASSYEAEIQIVYEEQEINAKSIMGVMSLGISQKAEVVIRADGEDETEALSGLVDLIEGGFVE